MAALSVWLLPGLSAGAVVQRVRWVAIEDTTRIIIDLDAPAPYTILPLDDGIIVKMLDTVPQLGQPLPTGEDARVKDLNLKQGTGLESFLSITLQDVRSSYSHFALREPPRIIVDVKPPSLLPSGEAGEEAELVASRPAEGGEQVPPGEEGAGDEGVVTAPSAREATPPAQAERPTGGVEEAPGRPPAEEGAELVTSPSPVPEGGPMELVGSPQREVSEAPPAGEEVSLLPSPAGRVAEAPPAVEERAPPEAPPEAVAEGEPPEAPPEAVAEGVPPTAPAEELPVLAEELPFDPDLLARALSLPPGGLVGVDDREVGRGHYILSSALRLFREERYAQAQSLLERLLAEEPEGESAGPGLVLLGNVYLQYGREGRPLAYHTALDQYRRFNAYYPDSPLREIAQYQMGQAYLGLRFDYEAASSFAEFVRKFPRSRLLPQAHLQWADALFRINRFREASNEYRRILETYTDQPDVVADATIGIGDAFYKMGRSSAAEIIYEEAVKRWPDRLRLRPETLMLLAAMHDQKGEYDKSQPLYEVVANVFQKERVGLEAMLRWAESYRREGNLVNALKTYNELLELYPAGSPEAFEARLRMAEIGMEEPRFKPRDFIFDYGPYNRPITTYRELLEENPIHPEADQTALKLARALHNNGQYAEAMQFYEQVLDRAFLEEEARTEALGGYQRALVARVQRAAGQGDLLEVLQLFTHNRLSPDEFPPELLYLAADAQFQFTLYEQAIDNFSRFLQRDGDPGLSAKALLALGDSYMRLGRLAEAEDRMRRFLAEFPQHEQAPLVWHQLGDLLLNQGRTTEAVETYLRAIRRDHDHQRVSLSYFRLATALKQESFYPEATQAYERSIEAFLRSEPTAPPPDHVKEAYFMRADLLYRDGEYEGALEAYREAAGRFPGEARSELALFLAGQSYQKLDRHEMAKAAWEELLANSRVGFVKEMAEGSLGNLNWLEENQNLVSAN